MKKLLFALSLNMMSSTFCGLKLSKMLAPLVAPSSEIKQSRKIKIGNKEMLVSILQNKATGVEGLDYLAIVDVFAEQNMDEYQIEQTLDATFNSAWIQLSAQIENQIGKAEFEKQKDTRYGNFMRQCLDMKPEILEGIREAAKANTTTKE